MARASHGDVEIEYEAFGDLAGEALLLINGLGSQMTRWPEAFCELLAARGLYTIRFDNRDVGLSTWCEGKDYSVGDMAGDAAAVLDAAGKRQAHIVGISMGGMIAQVFASAYPERSLSLTSIMSNTGNPDLPPPTSAAMEGLMARPQAPTDPDFIKDTVARAEVIGSPDYPWPPGALAERARAEADRAFNPPGVARQMAAIRASGDRRPRLAAITAPTVVLHGEADPLAPVAGGRDTAANIKGAELRVIPGMGHDLPPALYQTFVDAIGRAVERAHVHA
ncbi:MAG TPA: alpha/beta hydrolase [Caulobacteraceae bacterium]|jgi:pimeloyl-ACP methyl ester carboxylesterase|nr:alpha/beta hydrolase [Caulobacteraceae bacterium]